MYQGDESKPKKKRIGILTSGGDSPGMNAALRAAVRSGICRGCEIYAIHEGFQGLIDGKLGGEEEEEEEEEKEKVEEREDYGGKKMASEPPIELQNEPFTNDECINFLSNIEGLKTDFENAKINEGINQEGLTDQGGSGDQGVNQRGSLAQQLAQQLAQKKQEIQRRNLKFTVPKGIRPVTWNDVSGIISRGGTVIGTARSKEMYTKEGRRKAVYNLITLGIDNLIVIGGDGSLTGANTLSQEWPELTKELCQAGAISQFLYENYRTLTITGIVGSIDNDMWGTDLTIGADSSLHRIIEAIDSLSSTAESHQRVFVIEVMGRNCGWLALMAALATGADWLLIPENPCGNEQETWENLMCRNLLKHREAGKRSLMVIIAEGAIDRFGKPIKSDYIKQILCDNLHVEARVTVLGHVQRGGTASSFDRYLGTVQGAEAVSAILEAKPNDPSVIICLHENKVVRHNLMECVTKTQAVAKAVERLDFEEAMNLRGDEFKEAYDTYMITSRYNDRESRILNKCLRIGIVHTGAPAAGMNITTQVAVRMAINAGHSVLGIQGGFEGLINGHVAELKWNHVSGWANLGGSHLRTNRSLPGMDMGLTAFSLQKFAINALLVIGGFEAFTSVLQLVQSRDKYPQFCIPILHIPATISNNVPGTDYSLGSDTSLNTIITACDLIKMSASSSAKRVFVVETMGGKCGYLATLAGLGSGASRVYVPEQGITIGDLYQDVKRMNKTFSYNKNEGRIILRNEESSGAYTTDFITILFNEEGRISGLFDCRSVNLGHLQQGGSPSPLDRVRGVRFATKGMAWIIKKASESLVREHETEGENPHDQLEVFCNTTQTATVLGIKGGRIQTTAITELLSDTNLEKRRPINQWWERLIPLLDLLSSQKLE